jgi:ribosome-binding factor A
MNNSRVSDIKRAQKESLLLHELSSYFLRITLDDERLKSLTLNRVKLSRDKSSCTLFFFCEGGAEMFKELLPALILYKPSMRKALADQIEGRYTPQLIFKYDAPFERQLSVEALLDKIKEEEKK